MDKDLRNILSNLNKESGQEKLLEYLKRQMSEAERHEFEKQLLDDPFMNDAAEGLGLLKEKADLDNTLHELNKGLKKQLAGRKKKKEILFFNQPWAYVAVILILILAVVAFILIKRAGN